MAACTVDVTYAAPTEAGTFTSTKIMVIADSGTCGSAEALTDTALSNGADTTEANRAKYTWGTQPIPVPGTSKVCWCASGCSDRTTFLYHIGALTFYGRHT